MKYLIAFALILTVAPLAGAQSLADRLADVEANTATINGRLAAVEAKIDAIAAKVDALAKPAPVKDARAPFTSAGRTFVYDAALAKYRPEGAGWQYDAGSDSWWRYQNNPCPAGVCGNCQCPPGDCPQGCPPQVANYQPMYMPMQFGSPPLMMGGAGFGGPMMGGGGNCRGGG